MKKLLIPVVAILAIASCATISPAAAEREAESLLSALSQGDVDSAIDMSSRPFLFEGEILVSEAILTRLWEGLSELDLDEAEVSSFALVDEDSWMFFDDSWEVKTWLENYTNDETAVVFFSWESRELVIVVDRDASNKARIQGFGEVK